METVIKRVKSSDFMNKFVYLDLIPNFPPDMFENCKYNKPIILAVI